MISKNYLSLFGKIPEIDKILATCRKFEISIQIILQNLSQLKKMYKEGWEEFGGNCDTMIYLGGKDQFTNEYISKELGKETIDQQSINQTKGKQGSSSYNNAILGRELATLDELSAMDNNDCIVMVRGLPPFFTHKFDISNHPRYAELGERWKPAEGQTELDNPYIYILEDKMFTVPETEYIELTDFISTGDADETNMVEVRCVFSDEELTITEDEIMADVPYEIRKKFKGCTELFTAAYLYIISDMEFDCCTIYDETIFNAMKKLYSEHGYKLPQIVFWNVNHLSYQVPVTKDEKGAVLVSGFSKNLFNYFIQAGSTPLEFMKSVLDSERYRCLSA